VVVALELINFNDEEVKFAKTVVQSKADHPRTGCTDTLFCSCVLDSDPMTLLYKLYLKFMKMYKHAKSERSTSKLSKVRAS